MENYKEILAVIGRSLLIVIAALFIVISAAGIVGVWHVNRVATDVTLKVFSVVETGVSIGSSGVNQALTKVADARAENAQTEDDLKTLGSNIQENHPALTALSERLDTQLAPTVEKIQSTLEPVQEAMVKLNAVLTIANSVPYVQEKAPDLKEAQAALKTVLGLQADIQQLRTTLREAAEGKSDELTQQTMGLLLNITDRIDQRLAQTQSNLEELQDQINELSQRIAAQKAEILFILNLTAVIITLMFLWLIYTQIVVISDQVRKLRGGPECPECPEIGEPPSSLPPGPTAPEPAATSLPDADPDIAQSLSSD